MINFFSIIENTNNYSVQFHGKYYKYLLINKNVYLSIRNYIYIKKKILIMNIFYI